MKRYLVLIVLLVTLPLFAGKVLLMSPVTKDINRSDAKKIDKNLYTVFKKKFNFISYDDLLSSNRSLAQKVASCGSDEFCWGENADAAERAGFDYAVLTSVKIDDNDEMLVKMIAISLLDEEIIGSSSNSFGRAKDISAAALWKLSKSALSSVYDEVKAGARSNDRSSSRNSSMERERREREEKRLQEERDRQKREDELKQKREAERQKREEIERRKEEERERKIAEEKETRRRELEQQRRIEEEKKRREREEVKRKANVERKRRQDEMERLENERRQREMERSQKAKNKEGQLKTNASKLESARNKVIDMCSEGKYNDAIRMILKVEKYKCECEEDAKVLALKTQLMAFNKVRSKIVEGIKLLNHNLILDNLEAAVSLDKEIVDGGTNFSQSVDKVYAIGYYAKALAMEKKDDYVAANENYEKCIDKDPDKSECQEWLDSKDELVKKLYSKANVTKNFNPTKAKELLRSILKLVNADNDTYKKAEKTLKELE